MKFQKKLIKGIIHKRYKRFLSDIELSNGEQVCAHVPNTGAMTTCWGPGWSVYLTPNNDPKRKLKYTLELTDNGKTLICVNTSITNKIVQEALELNLIPELTNFDTLKAEKKIFDSRLDFYLTGDNISDTYIEVKNVTLLGSNNQALFPDAVTTRGQKHLRDLIKIKKLGHRAVMLYIINRGDITSFSCAKEVDPVYSELLKEAKQKGVEVLAYQTRISCTEIVVDKKIEVIL